MFLSKGVHNRICEPCDNENNKRTQPQPYHKMDPEYITKQEEKQNKDRNNNT